MKICDRNSKVRVYAVSVFNVVFFLDVIQYCSTASVKTVRQFRPDVYIVTPEPSSSEARDFPYFVPTPIPDESTRKPPEVSPHKYAFRSTTTRPFSSVLTAFPPFQPTPLPERYTRSSTSRYVLRSSATTKGPPDIIIAEFREGSSKNGKPNERMLSVKEMLSKEKVTGYSVTTSAPTSATYSQVKEKHNEMNVKDVWDIIKHNQDLETSTPRHRDEGAVAVDVVKSLASPSRNPEYTVETVPSISVSKDAWSSAEPDWKLVNKTLHSIVETTDEPRTIRGGSVYSEPPRPARVRYYPAYSGQGAYSSVDRDKYDLRPATGEAEDRYNPAQPYLPPHAKPAETKRPAPPAPLPAPPVPMPPPPPPAPPQPFMNAPSVTYDSIPSYSPPASSPPKPDTSGPPSDSYSYQPPDDSGPPSASFTSPSDDHSHHHHHHDHHDDDFKFELPPSDSSSPDSPGDQDPYPQLIFEDDHHSHHSSHEIDYHDLHEFYHHHHHHPPPPPPPANHHHDHARS